MGSSSSKPQHTYLQGAGYPAHGSQAYYYPAPPQAQFGYYYQQVGNDPTQVQAVPGYYYPPGQRPTHRKHRSTPVASNTLPRPARRRGHSDAHFAVSAVAPPQGAPTERPVDPTIPPAADQMGASDVPPRPTQNVPAETAAETDAPSGDRTEAAVPSGDRAEAALPSDDRAEPAQQPEPAPEPAPEPTSAPAPDPESDPEPVRAKVTSRLTNPLPALPRDVHGTNPYGHLRRAQTTGTAATSWQYYYNEPIASVSYKPQLRSQYRSKGKEPLKAKPREELKFQEKKSNGIGGGAFKLLRSFTMPVKAKKPEDPQRFYKSGGFYRYPPAAAAAPSGSPIIVTPDSPFYPTSSHKILYKKKLYPTAAHLFEAQQFLKYYPELAERIRTVGSNIMEMSLLSAKFQADGKVRSDWPLVWRDKMDEVLYMKFTQHPDLRSELMATGYAPLVDHVGARQPDVEGVNELGKALVRLRERLRREGAR